MIRRSALMLLAVSAACLAGSPVFAQEGPSLPNPGPEHAELKKFEGTWTATMKMAEAPEPMVGVATYKMECDGMWLASDFKMDVPGFKFQGKGLDGYDQNKKKFVGVWVDSMSTAPMFMAGTHDEKTKTTTMTGEGVGQDGKPEKFKNVTKIIDDDHFTFQMFMVGEGGKETLAFTIDYARRK